MTILFIFMVVAMILGLEVHADNEYNSDEYKEIGLYGFIFYYLRTALGDFDNEPVAALPVANQYALWSLWFITVFTCTIVFMNFLIAVITDVYESIIETKEEEIYLKKAELLKDMIDVLGTQKFKPVHYLISREVIKGPKSSDWSGFVHEIKSTVSNDISRATDNIVSVND
jgi:hypothetical protein